MSRVAITETVLVATNPASFARGATVYVYARGTETKASLFTAESGGSSITQPLTTDKAGQPRGSAEALAWVAPGSYDLKINGQTVPWEAPDGSDSAEVAGKEDSANKDTSTSLGTSDTKYPSQKAVKTYVDAEKTARESAIEIINLGTNWSSGDLSSAQLLLNVAGHKADLRDGTSGAPVETVKPSLKVSRVEKVTPALIGAVTGSETSDGAAGVAAINGSSTGVATSKTQAVGVYGGATNSSNETGTNVEPDACGIYGLGRVTGGTSEAASAIGGFLQGRRDVATARATAVELSVANYTVTDGSYTAAGSSDTKGIWLNAIGEADSGVAIQIQNAFGRQFKVGLGFGSQVAGGKTGGVAESSVRDDSESKYSFLVKGKHEKAAISVAKGAGGVIIGAEESSLVNTQGTLLDVLSESSEKSTIAAVRNSGANSVAVSIQNSKGETRIGAVGAAGAFLTGTAEGDSVIVSNSAKAIHLGRGGGVRAALRVSNNVGIGGAADSFGGGAGVVFLANATTAPTSNPTGGGILYCESGKLMYRGSSGTVKELATA